MALSLDVRHQRLAGRELDTGDLSFRRVGFLRLGDDQLRDDALALRTGVEQGGLDFALLFGDALGANGLVHCAE